MSVQDEERVLMKEKSLLGENIYEAAGSSPASAIIETVCPGLQGDGGSRRRN
jgi:hypothetical protein